MKLKSLFSEITPESFPAYFADEKSCHEFLAQKKWGDDFVCKKCGHTNYCPGKTTFSRRCTRCKHDESATAHTPFHGCRMPLNIAFQMAFQVCCQPEISTYELSRNNQIRQMTCWKLKKKVMDCLDQS
jgi:hypothetical protein